MDRVIRNRLLSELCMQVQTMAIMRSHSLKELPFKALMYSLIALAVRTTWWIGYEHLLGLCRIPLQMS